jgi:hypothetical protein
MTARQRLRTCCEAEDRSCLETVSMSAWPTPRKRISAEALGKCSLEQRMTVVSYERLYGSSQIERESLARLAARRTVRMPHPINLSATYEPRFKF